MPNPFKRSALIRAPNRVAMAEQRPAAFPCGEAAGLWYYYPRCCLALHGRESLGGKFHSRGTRLRGLIGGQRAVGGAEAQAEGQ